MKNRIITFGFVIILSSFLVATVIMEDREYSAIENRYLEQKPEFSWEALVSGEYMKKMETYLADQVALKDSLVTLKTDAEQILNRQGTNGVYFGKKGQYVKAYQPDEQKYEQNLSFIRSFVDAYQEQYHMAFVLAPNVQSIYTDVLPSDIVMGNADADRAKAETLFSDITFVDPTEVLRAHKKEYLYFKTDHHWTMRGAYYGYAALAEAMGWNSMEPEDYDIETVHSSFYGSLYSKAPLTWAKKDKVEVFYNVLGKYRITFEDGSHVNSLFVNSNLYVKDKYTYFLDGNHSFSRIQSNSKSQKKALVFKDSYSHVMLPFIADQYAVIDVVDLRYYREDIPKLLEEGGYDDILFIYNLDFITSDDNFVWLNMD